MSRIDIDAVTAIVKDVSAEFILPRFRNLGSGEISFKVGDDPVTIADKEAESALTTRLPDLLRGSKVLGEEAFAANPGVFESISGDSPVWIIDPVDGTRNFVRGNPEFGVIIALAEQNQVIAGWLYDPTSGEIITTERGGGAWYRGERLKVSSRKPLSRMSGFIGDSLVVDYKKSGVPKGAEPAFETTGAGVHEYPRLVLDRRHFGKDKPQMDFRASKLHSTPWDDGAGVLMHEEAGGYSAFWDGSPYRPSVMKRGLALAPDRESWEELRAWCRTFSDLPDKKRD